MVERPLDVSIFSFSDWPGGQREDSVEVRTSEIFDGCLPSRPGDEKLRSVINNPSYPFFAGNVVNVFIEMSVVVILTVSLECYFYGILYSLMFRK